MMILFVDKKILQNREREPFGSLSLLRIKYSLNSLRFHSQKAEFLFRDYCNF